MVWKAPVAGNRLVREDPSGKVTVELTHSITNVAGLLPAKGIIASLRPAFGHTWVTVPDAESYVALRVLTPSVNAIASPYVDSTRLKTPVDWPKGEVALTERPRMSCALTAATASAETMREEESLNMIAIGE